MKSLKLIKHKETERVIYSCLADSFSEAVKRAHQDMTNLSGADLSWAGLSGADLRWANLSGADLSGVNLWDLGQDRRGYRFLLFFDKETKTFTITAGCRSFNLTEAREHWEARHKDDAILHAETLGRVALAEAIAASVQAA